MTSPLQQTLGSFASSSTAESAVEQKSSFLGRSWKVMSQARSLFTPATGSTPPTTTVTEADLEDFVLIDKPPEVLLLSNPARSENHIPPIHAIDSLVKSRPLTLYAREPYAVDKSSYNQEKADAVDAWISHLNSNINLRNGENFKEVTDFFGGQLNTYIRSDNAKGLGIYEGRTFNVAITKHEYITEDYDTASVIRTLASAFIEITRIQ